MPWIQAGNAKAGPSRSTSLCSFHMVKITVHRQAQWNTKCLCKTFSEHWPSNFSKLLLLWEEMDFFLCFLGLVPSWWWDRLKLLFRSFCILYSHPKLLSLMSYYTTTYFFWVLDPFSNHGRSLWARLLSAVWFSKFLISNCSSRNSTAVLFSSFEGFFAPQQLQLLLRLSFISNSWTEILSILGHPCICTFKVL